MKVRKVFALSILATSVALAAGCSSDDDDEETPDTMEPGTMEPGTMEPGTGEPGTMEPGTGEPGTMEPVEDTTTNTGTSILDIARGTDGDDEDMEIDTEGDNAPNADLTSLVAAAANYPAILNLLDDETQTLTVFAPNNDAFAALTETPDADTLERILQYHVLAGTNLDATAVSGLTVDEATTFTTAAGADLSVTLDGTGAVSVTDAMGNVVPVLATVDSAANGTVHVIGSILMPPAVEPMEPGEDGDGDGGPTPGAEGSALAGITGDAELSEFAALVDSSDFSLSLEDANNNRFVTFAPVNGTLAEGVTDARAYVVSSLPEGSTGVPPAGDYTGTGEQALSFTLAGEGEALTVNGQPASVVATGNGGTVIKYGSEED